MNLPIEFSKSGLKRAIYSPEFSLSTMNSDLVAFTNQSWNDIVGISPFLVYISNSPSVLVMARLVLSDPFSNL